MKDKTPKTKKRKLKNVDTQSPEKKRKDAEKYTEVYFKVELKDPNTTFSALDKFIDESSRYSEDGGYDIVAGYCRSSEECTEILQLLEGGKRKPGELCLIFGTLESVLIRLADDLSAYRVVGQNIVKKLWGSHTGCIYSSLSQRNKSSHIKTTLKLLTAMTMLDDTSAKAILTQIDFTNQNIQMLYTRRDRKDPQDVRTCLIHFVLAFMLSGSDSTIRQLMDAKDFSRGLFEGLCYDSIETVQIVLNTFLEKVIQNPVISKTQKVRVFNEEAMKHLGKLYNWTGIQGWRKSDRDKQENEMEVEDDSNTEEKQMAAESVHKVVMELCSSYKHGIIFFDKSFGTSQKNQNHILTSFLPSLTKMTDSPLIQELVIATLVACPDQLQHYLPCLQNSLTPRLSQKWISTMEFISKIYSSQSDTFCIPKIKESIPTRKLVSVLLLTVVPPHQTMTIVIQGLKHKDLIVRHTSLDFVKLMLRRSMMLLKYLSNEGRELLQNLYKQEEITEVTGRVEEEISKVLPEFTMLLSCWDKLMTYLKGKGDTPEDEVPSGLEAVSKSSHMIRLEQVMSLYQGIFPSCLTDNPTNISKIMEGVKQLTEQSGETDKDDVTHYLPQLYLLKLLAGADSRKLPWVKENQEGHSLMYLLLEMLRRIRTKMYLVKKTGHLICQLLTGTGLFNLNTEELSLWIRHYSQALSDLDDADGLTQFLSKVFTTYISNPYPYSDKVNDLAYEGMNLEPSGMDVDTLSIGTTDSNIDALMEMDEGEIDEKTDDVTEDDPVLNKIRFPFSPPLVVSFEILSKKEMCTKERTGYLSSLLIDILHSQLNPYPLICLLQSHPDVPIDKDVRSYIMCFTKLGKKPDLTTGPVDTKSLTGETSAWMDMFLTCKTTIPPEILSILSTVSEDNSVILTRQLLLYINHYLTASHEDKEIIKTVRPFFKGIEEIIRNLSEKVKDDSGSTTEASKLYEDFQELDIAEKTKEDLIQDILEIVLKHPLVLKCFLFVEDTNVRDIARDSPKLNINFLSKFVTDNLCSLLSVLKDLNVGGNLHFCFEKYVDKTQRFLCNIEKFGKSKLLPKVFSCVQTLLPLLAGNIPESRILDLISITLKLPKQLLCDQNSLTNLGNVAVQLLLKLLNDSDGKLLKIEPSCVKSLIDLDFDVSDDQLRTCCCRLLEEQAHLCQAADSVIVNKLFLSGDKDSIKIVENIILHNECQADHFRQHFQKGALDQTLEKLIPVVLTISRKIGHKKDDSSQKWLRMVSKKYKKLIDKVCNLTEENGSNTRDLVILLVKYGILEKDKMFKLQMKAVAAQDICSEHCVSMLDFLAPCAPEHQLSFLKYLVRCFVDLHGNKENMDDVLCLCIMEKILTSLQNVANELDFESKLLQKLIKVILKSRFSDRRTFQIILKFAASIHDWPTELPLTMLYQMVISHSLFLPIMFNEKFHDVKGDLCDLLLCLVETDSNCCSEQHYGIFLGSYLATLSETDQKLLKLMYLYEKNECVITEYRPYLWGPKAIEHHSVQKTIGPSLLKKASIDQVIENLDQTKLQTSVLNFPLRRKLKAFTIQDSRECKSIPEVYDPCFILPLFSHLLSPDQLFDCRKFIEKGCLGYVLAALSCHDSTMRGAAYHVLGSFLHHLEGSRFQEKEQVLYLIDLIKNSLEKPNMKLSCIISIFLAKMSNLMLKAEQHMYQMMNTFLYLKPSLDIHNVPEFYKLFNSSTLEYKEERTWMLNLLMDGLRETSDYRTFEKRYTFKLLLSFYDTALSDNSSQNLVLKILNRACLEKTVALDLTRNHGIVSWLLSVIKVSDVKRTEIFTDILHDLWITMLGKKEKDLDGKAKFLSPTFTREMLMACNELVRKISDETSSACVIKVLETTSSVYQHLLYTCEKLKDQGHTYVPSVQTLADVQVLLRVSRLFSKHKSHSSEKPRQENVDKDGNEDNLSKVSENSKIMTVDMGDGDKSLSHEVLNILTLKLLLHWEPFRSSSDSSLSVCMSSSKDLCLTLLQTCMLMIQQIKSCNDSDLIEQTLLWIAKYFKNLIEPEQNAVITKSVKPQINDSLVQIQSRINMKYKDSVCYGKEDVLENSLTKVSDILTILTNMDE